MANHFSTSTLIGGRLYGFSGNMGRRGDFRVLDFKTGRLIKSWGEVGCGSHLVADGRLILLGERGTLASAKPSAGGIDVISKARILSGICWTMPALIDGRLYCRNRAGELKCFDVSGK
jgi:hypothetical protein